MRPVIILRILDDGLAVIESRSNPKSNLRLVLRVDFDRDRRYAHFKLRGASHFYEENFRVIPKKALKRRLGFVVESDYLLLAKRLGFPPLDSISKS